MEFDSLQHIVVEQQCVNIELNLLAKFVIILQCLMNIKTYTNYKYNLGGNDFCQSILENELQI